MSQSSIIVSIHYKNESLLTLEQPFSTLIDAHEMADQQMSEMPLKLHDTTASA